MKAHGILMLIVLMKISLTAAVLTAQNIGLKVRQKKMKDIKNSKLRKTAARNYNKPDTLEEKCKKINLYNKRHNTYYSYGEYTALVRAGKIISDVVSEKRVNGQMMMSTVCAKCGVVERSAHNE